MAGGEPGVSGLLDTSLVVRYLTDDPPELAERAARVLDQDEVALPPLVLVEAAYVLTKVYGVPHAATVDALVALLQKENVHVLGLSKETAIAALLLARPSGRVAFADALIWALAKEHGLPVYTFDRRFPGDEVEVRVL